MRTYDRARAALEGDGVLVLAIENHLGLKYLNGAREDHTGRLFEGIQGYPDTSTPVTFSARELMALLSTSGFVSAELLLPFPDYKLARTILLPARCTEAHHIHNWVDAPAPDRGSQRGPLHFNETLATREVARAGLLGDLANSFLIVAFAGDRGASEGALGLELGWAARHYSLDRRAGLRKRVTLAPRCATSRSMTRPRARPRARRSAPRSACATNPGAGGVAGDLVLLEVLATVAREGVGDGFAGRVHRHHSGCSIAATASAVTVRADALDVVVEPRHHRGRVGADRRRVADGGLAAVDFVLWRMLHHFALRHASQLPAGAASDALAFPAQWLRAAGASVTADALARFAELDRALQHGIATGAPLDAGSRELAAVRALTEMPRGFSVVASAEEISADPELLAAYARHFAAGDDATLVLYAPGADEAALVNVLERAMTAAGLGDGAPDMLLFAPPDGGPTAEAGLAHDASALLSRRDPSGPFAGLPRSRRRGRGPAARPRRVPLGDLGLKLPAGMPIPGTCPVPSCPALAIVPTFLRSQEELDVVLRGLVSLRHTAPDATVLVVDDHSPAEDLARLLELAADELGAAFVRADANAGFATTVNVGLELALANGMDAVLVNADVEFPEAGWLDRMRARTDTAGRPAAVVGARLLYPNGLLQHAGIFFSALARGFGHRFQGGPADLPEALVPARCPVTAALQLVRLETLATVGLYDASFGLAFEDVDYCLRVFEAGLECIYEPTVLAIHHEQYFRGKRSKRTDELHQRSNELLLEKYAATDMGPWTPAAL